MQTEIHASDPAEGGAEVLTAEPVLEKMLSGASSSKDALSRELIAIDYHQHSIFRWVTTADTSM